MTDDEDRCAACGKLITPADDWTAHWGGPGSVQIVAWTCSAACTAKHGAPTG